MEKKKILTYFVALATVAYLGVPLTYAQTEPTCNPDTLTQVRYGQRSEAVRNLQACLIQAGYDIPAGATGYYGSQTVSAVKKFYAEWYGAWNGRSVGPKGIAQLKKLVAGAGAPEKPTTAPSTQALEALLKALGLTDQQIAAIMAIVSGTATPTAPTAPAAPTAPTAPQEGFLTVEQEPTVTAPSLRENETGNVFGLRFRADNAAVTVKSMILRWNATYAPYRLLSKVEVVDDQGNVLLSENVDSTTFLQDTTLNYYLPVTGLNVVVPKNSYKSIFVRGTIVGTLPSGASSFSLYVDPNDVRGTDEAGVDRFGPTSRIPVQTTLSTSLAQQAQFVITRNVNTPQEGYIFGNVTDGKASKQTLLTFDVKAKDDNIRLTGVTVNVNATSNVSTLYIAPHGGNPIAVQSVPQTTTTVTFNLVPNQITINKDQTQTFDILADLTGGTTIPATVTVAVTAVQGQNSLGGPATSTGNAVSNNLYYLTIGPQLSLASKSVEYQAPSQAVLTSTLTARFEINVTPKGGDIYAPTTASQLFEVVLEQSNGTTTTTGISAVMSVYQGGNDITGTWNGTLSQDNQYTFKLTVVYTNQAKYAGLARLKINSVNWGTTSTKPTENSANFVRNSYYTDWVNIQ
ncbi:MAG: peptidoglycan-binding domain-containing protein [Minisyncoccia bacterium]